MSFLGYNGYTKKGSRDQLHTEKVHKKAKLANYT